MRLFLVAALIFLGQQAAMADGRINTTVDFNRTNLSGAYNEVGLKWQGINVEFEKTFTEHNEVLSGIAFGVRRELFYAFTGFGGRGNVDRWDEGTYLSVRIYRYFDLQSAKRWSIGPSFSLLYGIPGTTLDRTTTNRYGDGYSYLHVFPVRNGEVPAPLATAAGLATDTALFYPEVSVALRRQFAKGGISVDWVGGVRIIRFGLVDSGAQGDAFKEKLEWIPSIGLRVGFRVF